MRSMSYFGECESQVMSRIEKVESGKDKAVTYKYQMERYKLSIDQQFYFEAIVIAYAMLEDRLLAFLHYAGVIDRRTEGNQAEERIYVSTQAQKQIKALLKRKTDDKIYLDTISIKIKTIKKLMSLPEENNDPYLNSVRAQIDKTINRKDFNALLQKLSTWLNPRNQIIHALMGKRTEAVLKIQAGIAEEGYQLGRALDGFVSKLKAGNKDGIRILEKEGV